MSWTTLITWLIVGALAGALTGMVVKQKKRGYGPLANLGIGLVGALIGGGLFRVFGIDLGLGRISISAEDLLSAFLGSLIFLAALRFYRSRSTTGS